MYRAIGFVLAATLIAGVSWVGAGLTSAPLERSTSQHLSLDGPIRPNRAEIDRLIAEFESRAQAHTTPFDQRFLARLYLAKARLNGDPRLYEQAQEMADSLARLRPDDSARLLQARAALGLHAFEEARAAAEQITVRDPGRLDAIAVLGDAQFEMGDYEGADHSYGLLADLESPSVLVRISRLEWLRGDVEGAIDLALQALQLADEAGLHPVDRSWYRVNLSHLYSETGRYILALNAAEEAVEVDASSHQAWAQLGRSLAALGRFPAAAARYERALQIYADSGHLKALGDIQLAMGHEQAAERSYEVAVALAGAPTPDGWIDWRELASLYADRGIEPDRAVELAGLELGRRQDPETYDVLAWALYRAGRFQDARDASDRALEHRTPDAHFWYHAGLISDALGDGDRALGELKWALAISPQFDVLLAADTRARVAQLELPR